MSYDITWNPAFYSTELSPIGSPIDIDFSQTGASWSNLATAIPNSGSFTWSVPSVNLSGAQIRITATDKLGNTTSVIKTFVIDSTNPTVAIDAITTPNGGEYLKGSTGSGITITWNTGKVSDTNLGSTPVTLAYSTNGSTWNTIASGLGNAGTYLWTGVPALNSATVRIKLTATDLAGNTSTDISDADFTIDSTLPNIAVITPPTPATSSFISAG